MFTGLEKIFESFLGKSARGVSENGQVQFDCPFCGSGKPNLEVSFTKLVYKSWCCPDEHGSLSKLIRQFANDIIFNEYKNEINNIKESRLYQINRFKFNDNYLAETALQVPECCEKINPNRYNHKKAYEYCTSRGINSEIIDKYNIQCTTYDCADWQMRQRIIIPSYDKFQQLNYWVGRIYKDNPYQTKYHNPTSIHKKDIIFNEYLLQWDGDIRLVEGPLDSIVVPNSTALLGKELNSSFVLYKALLERAHSITLIPDADSEHDWYKIGYNLNIGRLRGKIRMVQWNEINISNAKDTSDIYRIKGYKGVAELLKTANPI